MSNGDPLFLVYYFSFILLLSLYGFFGFYFLLRYMRSEDKTTLRLSYAVILLLLCVGRLFLVLFDLTTNFSSLTWLGEGFFLWIIGMSIQIGGFGIFLILMEKRILQAKDKYILAIIYFSVFVIGLILGNILIIIIGAFSSLFIPIAYLWVAFKSEGSVRKRAFLVAFGIIFILLASLFQAGPIINAIAIDNIIIHSIAYFIKSTGAILLFLGFKE